MSTTKAHFYTEHDYSRHLFNEHFHHTNTLVTPDFVDCLPTESSSIQFVKPVNRSPSSSSQDSLTSQSSPVSSSDANSSDGNLPLLPHQCQHCKRSFKRKDHLTRHVTVVHEKQEKYIQCHLCHYKCRRNEHFETHMKRHSPETPFRCRWAQHSAQPCFTLFACRRTMIEHEKTVHGREYRKKRSATKRSDPY